MKREEGLQNNIYKKKKIKCKNLLYFKIIFAASLINKFSLRKDKI